MSWKSFLRTKWFYIIWFVYAFWAHVFMYSQVLFQRIINGICRVWILSEVQPESLLCHSERKSFIKITLSESPASQADQRTRFRKHPVGNNKQKSIQNWQMQDNLLLTRNVSHSSSCPQQSLCWSFRKASLPLGPLVLMRNLYFFQFLSTTECCFKI